MRWESSHTHQSVRWLMNTLIHTTKVQDDLKKEALSISCAVQSIVEEEDEEEIQDVLNFVFVLNQVTPENMVEEQKRDPICGLVWSICYNQGKIKIISHHKIKSKTVRKYLLHFDRLTFKQGVLH